MRFNVLVILALLVLSAGVASAASVKTYGDSIYSEKKDLFTTGETVYLEAQGINADRGGSGKCALAKVEYYAPHGLVPAYAHICNDSACYSEASRGILKDSLVLGSADPAGEWAAIAYRNRDGDGACRWQFAGHAKFEVKARAPGIGCGIYFTSPANGSVFLSMQTISAAGRAACTGVPEDYYAAIDWGDGTTSPRIALSGASAGPWEFTTEPGMNRYYSASGPKQITAKLYRGSGLETPAEAKAGTVLCPIPATDPVAVSPVLTIIINAPPVSIPGAGRNGTLGEAVYFEGSASYDPDGMIVNYIWDFGDGTGALGKNASHAYGEIGVFNATLTVTDNLGAGDENGLRVTVYPPEAEYVTVSPQNITLATWGKREYTATAHDGHGNEWDATANTVFSSFGGDFNGSTFTAGSSAGTYLVTAQYLDPVSHGVLSASTYVLIVWGEARGISISPKSASVPIQGTLPYSALASDTWGNSWDITSETVFSSEAGTFSGNVLAAGTVADVFDVAGAYGSYSDTGKITVTPGPATVLRIYPEGESLFPNGKQNYSAVAADEYGNEWDVTDDTAFSADGGSFSGNALTAGTVAGVFNVAGVYGPLSGTAGFTITMGSIVEVRISPENATVAVGGELEYATIAYDEYGNHFDVTGISTFSSSGGEFSGNFLTAGESPGVYDVNATLMLETGGSAGVLAPGVDRIEADAPGTLGVVMVFAPSTKVTVVPQKRIDYMTIEPANAVLPVGTGAYAYSVTAHDSEGGSWDVTAGAHMDTNAGFFIGNLFFANSTAGVYGVNASVPERTEGGIVWHYANTGLTLVANETPTGPSVPPGPSNPTSGGSSYGFSGGAAPTKPPVQKQCQSLGESCSSSSDCCEGECASGVCAVSQKPARRKLVEVIAPEVAYVGSQVPVILLYFEGRDPVPNAVIRVISPTYEIIPLVTDSAGAASYVPSDAGRYDCLVPDYELAKPASTYARAALDDSRATIRRWETKAEEGPSSLTGFFLFNLAPELLGLVLLVLLLSIYGMHRIYSENQEPEIQLDIEPLVPLRMVRKKKKPGEPEKPDEPKEPQSVQMPLDGGAASIETMKEMIEGKKENQ